MYNTPTRRNHPGSSPGNRILFRSCGGLAAFVLLIFALKFAGHRGEGLAGWLSFLFAIFIFLFTLAKKHPGALSWFTFFGLVALAVVILGILEM
jgi:hypothetical protein